MSNMTNKLRSLDDIPIAYMMDDSWLWKDDMIVWPRDDGFYDGHEYADSHLSDDDHPICGEFPHDSVADNEGSMTLSRADDTVIARMTAAFPD